MSIPVNELPDEVAGKVVRPRESVELMNAPWRIWACIYLRNFLIKYGIRCNETPGAQHQDTGFSFAVLAAADRYYSTASQYYHYRIDNPAQSLNNPAQRWRWDINELSCFESWLQSPHVNIEGTAFYQSAKFRLMKASLHMVRNNSNYTYVAKLAQDQFKAAKEKGQLDRRFFSSDAWRYLNLLLFSKTLFRMSLQLYPVLFRIASLNRSNHRLRPNWNRRVDV
jgi:hypothetical protein